MKEIQPKYAKSKENEHMKRLQQNHKTNCKNTAD